MSPTYWLPDPNCKFIRRFILIASWTLAKGKSMSVRDKIHATAQRMCFPSVHNVYVACCLCRTATHNACVIRCRNRSKELIPMNGLFQRKNRHHYWNRQTKTNITQTMTYFHFKIRGVHTEIASMCSRLLKSFSNLSRYFQIQWTSKSR